MIFFIKRFLFNILQRFDSIYDGCLRDFLNLAGANHFVEDHIDLVEVEDDVQLAHVGEEVVERLDEEMNELEVGHVVVVDVDAQSEEEPRVAPVDELEVAVLYKIREAGFAGRDEAMNLHLLAIALGVVARDVPLDHAGLSHSVLNKEEMNHFFNIEFNF